MRTYKRMIEEENEDDIAIDDSTMSDMPFAGLDLRFARCFGYSLPAKDNWLNIAKQSEDMRWDFVDSKQLEQNLADDVEKSYQFIAEYKLTNVDDDMNYVVKFNNNEAVWQIEIANSPKAEMTIEERADFFKSGMMKKIAKQTYKRLINAKETYDKLVDYRMKNGEFLNVDLAKFEAIYSFLDNEHFMQNILKCKYLSY